MIASLPMYDTGVTAAANDRLWAAIRHILGGGPAHLDRVTDPHATWLDPALLLSQTCGLPYRGELHGKVQLVGTPDYGVEGCAPGYYCSCIVVRADDPRQTLSEFAKTRLARNDVRSQSGWAALVQHMREDGLQPGWQGGIVETGGHANSAQAVADGRADIAALDAVTWRLLRRDSPVAGHLRVLTTTRPTPGLPYITSLKNDARAVHDAVDGAIKTLSEDDRETLLLRGITMIPARDYLAVPLP